MRDEKVKWNFAYRSEYYSRRDGSPSFMEFVHRLEERQEQDDRQIKEHALHGTSQQISAEIPTESPSPPLISLADLLLAGALMFLFITLLLLIMS